MRFDDEFGGTFVDGSHWTDADGFKLYQWRLSQTKGLNYSEVGRV